MIFGQETETMEFKKTTSELKEGVNSVCAILNKHNKGELYFGMHNSGKVLGQEVSDKTLREVSQAITDHIEPRIFPEIEAVNIDGKTCIRVCFEGYDTPYFAYGVAKIRVADEDKVMSPQQLKEFFSRQSGFKSKWEEEASEYDISDVNESAVKKFIEKAKSEKRLAIDYTGVTSTLDRLDLIKNEKLKNAGAALFCKSRYNDLQLAVFATDQRLTFLDIRRAEGNIFELLDVAENYIKTNMRWRAEIGNSMERKEIPEVPVAAIREALANSFAHKDYESGQTNEVAIFKDRIEITNPGSFPEGYEPEDFANGELKGIHRNPQIAKALYLSHDAEGYGTGLKRITQACKEAGCRVEFKKSKFYFTIVFYRKDASLDGTTTQDTIQATTQDINSKVEQLLEFCAEPKSKNEMMNFLGLSSAKHFRDHYLVPLLNRGDLLMTLPDKPKSPNQKYVTSKNLSACQFGY